MKKLGVRNFTIIVEAIKITGSYDPNEIFFYFEEQLYIDESETIWDFLQWIVDGDTITRYGREFPERSFGHGNYEDRFKEFLNQR